MTRIMIPLWPFGVVIIGIPVIFLGWKLLKFSLKLLWFLLCLLLVALALYFLLTVVWETCPICHLQLHH